MEFRDLAADDFRYFWAAYKKGSLASMGEKFAAGEMKVEEFNLAFASELEENYHRFWTLLGETRKGFVPVGVVLAFWSHPDPGLAPYMVLNMMLWMPWASSRNKIESATHFLNAMRSQIPMIGFGRAADQKFFDVLLKHGIMRRVGTSFNVFPDGPAAVYETRRP